jgi:hypothetical protein
MREDEEERIEKTITVNEKGSEKRAIIKEEHEGKVWIKEQRR